MGFVAVSSLCHQSPVSPVSLWFASLSSFDPSAHGEWTAPSSSVCDFPEDHFQDCILFWTLLECLICSWVYGSIWIVPPLFGWSRFITEGFGTSCTFDYKSRDRSNRRFVSFLMIGGFVAPLSAIIASYTLIFSRLRRRAREFMRKQNSQSFTEHQTKQQSRSISTDRRCSSANRLLRRTFRRTELRATRRSIIICSVFCFSWGPYALTTLLFQFDLGHWINPYLTEILTLCTKLAACINPFVYLLSSSPCRAKFCHICPIRLK